MSSVQPIPDHEREELLALYQVTTQDLAFFKAQQWTSTNYALGAMALIVGIPSFAVESLGWSATLLLGASIIAVLLLSALVLYRLHQSIIERRDRLDRVYASLSPCFRDARGSTPRDRKSVV